MNRTQKNDKDAAEWLPALNQCWVCGPGGRGARRSSASRSIRAEVAALDRVLASCLWVANC